MDLVIKNGTVATPAEIFRADIGVEDGRIVELSQRIHGQAERVIDASGRYVLPGLIDVHTHMELPFMGTTSADDFERGSIAAACGGVTTYIDFAIQSRGKSLLATVEEWKKKADPKTCVDYSLHLAITDLNESTMKEVPSIIEYGVPSFKLFMPYRKEGLMSDDATIFSLLSETQKYGGVVCLHAENASLLESLAEKFLREGKTSPEYHAKSRPAFVEGEAISRAISLNREAGGFLYIVHMSTLLGRRAVRDAQYAGLRVYAETCPHYLTLTDDKYLEPEGANYVMSPPLRKKEDLEELWRGIADGDIKAIGSDHCPFQQKQKLLGKNDFTKIPNGVPGTEVILPIMFSDGVRRNRISLQRLVQVTSYNPAKLFGLYPRKGSICVGSDADLVVVDSDKKVTLTPENLHSNMDFSPYHDMTVVGYPTTTISRGRVVYMDGEYVGEKRHGLFLKRKPYPNI